MSCFSSLSLVSSLQRHRGVSVTTSGSWLGRTRRLQESSHVPELSRGSLFPIETWRKIFERVTEEGTDYLHQQTMYALIRTCSAFLYEAERLLYRRVTLTRGVVQIHSFKRAITLRRWRASTVVFLHIAIPPRSGDSFAKDIFSRLPNLVELHVDGMAEPHAVFARPSFRLHTLLISGESFRYLHGVEDCSRNPDHLTSEHNAPFQLDFLAGLTTLTLVQPTVPVPFPVSFESHRRLTRYCSFYGITHLNLVNDPTTLSTTSSVVATLGAQLISLRITTQCGTPPVDYVDWLSGPPWWPTHIMCHGSCPRLQYLELCQKEDYTYSQGAEYYNLEWEVGDLRRSCPAIKTLVWRPGLHHQMFADAPWYRKEVWKYTELLFSQWPTLERFERLRLDSENEEALRHAAYTRTEEGGISVNAVTYDADGWKNVQPATGDD